MSYRRYLKECSRCLTIKHLDDFGISRREANGRRSECKVCRSNKTPPLSAETRFWNNVPQREDGCWLWNGRKDGKGYGRLTVQGKQSGAHRFAWEFAVGPIPDGLCVLHRCDIPLCVRPDHLFLGTKADNSRDMAAKGRTGIRPKLSDSEAREVRERRDYGERGVDLAREFGISQQQVCNILKGRSRQRAFV